MRHEFVEFGIRKRLRADDQFVYGEPGKHNLRRKQHSDLGSNRSNDYCRHAGNIHVDIPEWFDDRESNRDDYLHTDCDQCVWLGHIHCESYCRSVGRSIGDNDHFVPQRNPRRGVRRLRNRRQRRRSALHLLRKHECQLSSIT